MTIVAEGPAFLCPRSEATLQESVLQDWVSDEYAVGGDVAKLLFDEGVFDASNVRGGTEVVLVAGGCESEILVNASNDGSEEIDLVGR